MFFEIHQPVRHRQVRRIVDRAVAAKCRGIFAVRIDHHDMPLRRHVADAVEDQRGGGRFAGAGRSQQREMLAQQRVDIKRSANVAGRMDHPDFDMRAVVGGIDLFQVRARHRIDRGAGHRVARDAAPEMIEFAGQPFLIALAQEIDLRGDVIGRIVGDAQRTDAGDQPDIADPHLDLTADGARIGQRGVGMVRQFGQHFGVEQHAARRSRNLEHAADRLRRKAFRSGAGFGVGLGLKRPSTQHLGHTQSTPGSESRMRPKR